MRKIILILLIFINLLFLHAFDFNSDEFAFELNSAQDVIVTNKSIYIIGDGIKAGHIRIKNKRPDNIINNNGYAEIFIEQNRYYLFEYNGNIIPISVPKQSRDYSDIEKNKKTLKSEYIKSIKSSSNLIETINGKSVEYIPENCIYKFFYFQRDVGSSPYIIRLPWVPNINIDKNPKLFIEFNESISMISFLNGFIDFYRPNLYLENARPKSAIVKDISNNISYNLNFTNSMSYNILRFLNPTNRIEVEYLDYFKGKKYDDPCIASIIVEKNLKKSGDYGHYILMKYKNEIDE